MGAQNETGPLPITGSDYLHVGTGDRYRVEAQVGNAVWLRRIVAHPSGTARLGTRACTPRMLFGRSFIPVEAAEGLLVVLGLIQVAEPPPEPVTVEALDAEVAKFAELLDDEALQGWLRGEGA